MSRLYPGPGAVVLASAPCKEDEKNSKKYALLFSFFSHLFISTRASKSTAGLRRSRRWHRSHMVRQSLPRVLDDQLMLPDHADQNFTYQTRPRKAAHRTRRAGLRSSRP